MVMVYHLLAIQEHIKQEIAPHITEVVLSVDVLLGMLIQRGPQQYVTLLLVCDARHKKLIIKRLVLTNLFFDL